MTSTNKDSRTTETGWARPFFTIWIGQALSLVGSRAGGFALVWWLTERSGSGTVLATATMVAMLPQIFLGPFIGALVDRWNRRRIMLVADSVIALLSTWLAYLFWADALELWHIYVIMFARALGGTFHHPAMQASTSLMVPQEQLARVAGMNQTLQGVMTIVTPPLGAFLMSILPLHWIMAIDVITAAFAIVPLFFIHIPQPPRRKAVLSQQEAPSTAVQSTAQKQSSLWQDVREGFLYIWHWPGMFMLLATAILLNFLITPAMSLLPLLITLHFQGDVLQLGWMNSAWGLGIIVGGLTLSAWGGFKKRIITSLVGIIGMGIGFLFVGLAPSTAFWLALGALLFAAIMNPITNGPIGAILQSVIAPDMQGRTFMIVGSIAGFAAPLGLAVAGPISDALGVGAWFIVGGVTSILVGIIAPFVPAIMQIEEQRQAHAEPETTTNPER
ncbi:MAG: MFS transporter [Anaerolineae bacterium]|nr:MFS transporter [Anaerolineae bacterium]